MPNIKDLRDQLNVLGKQMRALSHDTPPEKWTAEHAEQFDALEKEFSAVESQVARMQNIMDREAKNRGAVDFLGAAEKHGFAPDESLGPKAAVDALFQKWLRSGDKSFTAEDWEVVRNTMSTTTPGEGGYLAPDTTVASILDAMKKYGGMRQVSTVISTGTGNTMHYPTSDGTSEEGELVDQNTAASDADISFGTIPLAVYKYSSRVVTVPIELIQDSSVDILGFVRERLATRLGRITNRHLTTGTGVDQPTGVIVAASVGKTGATGSTTAIGYDDLIDLEHSVDPAYREGGTCGWMFNDTTLKGLRKLKDTVGRPIWMPGDMEGITGGIPATLLNHAYTINQHMASMAANAKSVAFGDFSKYVIRDAMALELLRFADSVYAKKGQVGFLAFLRSGGNLADVGGAVKVYQNSAT